MSHLLPPFTGWKPGQLHNRRVQELIDSAMARLDAAVAEYKITALYALFSGGHDSLVATHVAARHPLFSGVIHIDTGTGLPQTRAFVDQVCAEQGWDLIVKKPVTTYEMLIIKMGFPGPAMHGDMYRILKERPLRQAKKAASVREHQLRPERKKNVIAYATGARMLESDRRMGHVQDWRKDSEGVWVNTINDWSALDCTAYMKACGLPRSEVKDRMHLSGECFCGAFARADEKRELAFWYPDHARKIEAWEELVATAKRLGLSDVDDNRCRWGHKHGTPDAQMELFPMCYFCRGDGAEAA